MLRHVGFGHGRDFEAFHARNGPAHSYYSTAYYDRPEAPTMKEKGWMGAELIFDLDADHVPGAEKLAYPEQLNRVKDHFRRLVDEFVKGDFGFNEKDLLLTFSGGRGYHCHVLAERALELTSQERREIVDYITGTGLEVERFLREVSVGARGLGPYRKPVKGLKLASADSPGWGGRLNRAMQQYIARLRTMDGGRLAEEFQGLKGIGEKGLVELHDELQRLDERRVNEGYIDQGPVLRRLLPLVAQQQLMPLAKGETDEPVTSDTKRLIRTPGTLHGKSGLRVVVLRRDELDAFDPLVDAVAFGDEPIPVDVVKPSTVALNAQTLRLEAGRTRLPAWAAVFAVMRGWAQPAEAPAVA